MIVIHGGFGYNFRAAFTKVHGSIVYLFSSCQLPACTGCYCLGTFFLPHLKPSSPAKQHGSSFLLPKKQD